MLGTKAGSETSRLLYEHKEDLGVRVVEYVWVFPTHPGGRWTVYFFVANKSSPPPIALPAYEPPPGYTPPAAGRSSRRQRRGMSGLRGRTTVREIRDGPVNTEPTLLDVGFGDTQSLPELEIRASSALLGEHLFIKGLGQVAYRSSIARGTRNLERMAEWPRSGGGTSKTNPNLLMTTGWRYHEPAHQVSSPADVGMSEVFKDVSLSDKPADWKYVEWQHSAAGKYTLPSGRKIAIAPTGAYFGSFYNVKDGVIVATRNMSPETMAREKGKEMLELPIKEWSRVTGLSWLEMHTPGGRGLPKDGAPLPY